MSNPCWPVVVFDLDGTMVNTIPLIVASYEHALDSVLGVRADPAEARTWIGQTLYGTFSQRYPERATELVNSYVTWNAANLQALLETFDGVAEMLQELHAAGVRTGVATSKRRSSAEATVEFAGLAEWLPVTVAMEDTEVHKPDPLPLLLALDRLGSQPADAVYVGDAVVDVLAAKAAGLPVIAVTWGAGSRADLEAAEPTAVVDTIAELQALLLRS